MGVGNARILLPLSILVIGSSQFFYQFLSVDKVFYTSFLYQLIDLEFSYSLLLQCS